MSMRTPARASGATSANRSVAIAATMVIAAMATLVRSYVLVKGLLIGVLIFVAIWHAMAGRFRAVAHRRLVIFYVVVAFAGAAWAAVGLVRPSHYVQGVTDALRLYVLWSAAFAVLYGLIRGLPSLSVFHNALVAAGILIPVINIAGLCDQLFGLGLFSDSVRTELTLQIAYGDGHFQFASENMMSMFVIAPYLLTLRFRSDATKYDSGLSKLALVLSLAVVAFSGRRALWLVVALTPCTVAALAAATGTLGALKPISRRLLLLWCGAAVVGMLALFAIPEGTDAEGPIARLRDAFSSQDERSIQAPYLLDGFARAPLLGSGFGGYAGYQRNLEAPWTYELTYHTLLFNTGIIGTGLLVVLYGSYFVLVIGVLRRFRENAAVPFALVIALVSLLMGAYSNPYLGGFDTLFFAGLLPFLSTFDEGFTPDPTPHESQR